MRLSSSQVEAKTAAEATLAATEQELKDNQDPAQSAALETTLEQRRQELADLIQSFEVWGWGVGGEELGGEGVGGRSGIR